MQKLEDGSMESSLLISQPVDGFLAPTFMVEKKKFLRLLRFAPENLSVEEFEGWLPLAMGSTKGAFRVYSVLYLALPDYEGGC